MARSGVIYGSVSQMSSHFRSAIAWEENSQSVTNNSSSVTVRVLIDTDNDSYDWNGTLSNFKLTINGSTYTSGSFTSSTTSGWTYSASTSPTGRVAERIYSKTITIGHNSDGKKTFSMSSSFSLPSGGWGPGSVSISGSGTLDTIARASQPTLSDTTPTIGSAMTIYTNRASSSFTHTLTYSFSGETGTIDTGVGTSHSWTLPNSLASEIPNSTSSSGTITCKTYSGSTLVGTKSVNFTASLPSSFVPTFTSLTHAETVAAVTTVGAGYLQSLSKIRFTINGASGTYGSTIKSYSISFDGSTYTSSAATTGAVKGSGSLTATAKITDSRGRTASKSVTVTVGTYNPPKITGFTVKRVTSTGVADVMGTYASVYRTGTFSDYAGKNPISIKVKSKERALTTWTDLETTTDSTNGFTVTSTLGAGGYNTMKSYDFRIEVSDAFTTTVSLAALPTSTVTMSWAAAGIGIGKIWEAGTLDVGGMARFTKIETLANQYAPTGGGLNLNNSDILGLNQLFFNDQMTTDTEALQFPLSTRPAKGDPNYYAPQYYDSFRINAGAAYINSVPISVKPNAGTLWSGGLYMNDTTTITPTKKLSECANGWVLAFSDIDDLDVDKTNDSDIFLYLVPKRIAQGVFAGNGHTILSPTTSSGANITAKYIYIHDDKLVGSTANDGDAYDRDVCLRYVYEW